MRALFLLAASVLLNAFVYHASASLLQLSSSCATALEGDSSEIHLIKALQAIDDSHKPLTLLYQQILKRVPRLVEILNLKRKLSILNLAAGNGLDNYLYSFLFGSEDSGGIKVGANVWSIEIDPLLARVAEIDRSLLLNQPWGGLMGHISFIEGDGALIGSYARIPASIDLLMIRNPYADEAVWQEGTRPGWREMFDHGFDLLDIGGLAIITFVTQSEQRLIQHFWNSRHDLVVVDAGERVGPWRMGDAFYLVLKKVK